MTDLSATTVDLGDKEADMPMIPDLAPVSHLLKDYTTRERFLKELPPDSRLIAAEILQCASQLEETTGWDGDTLIRSLGCPTQDIRSFGRNRAQLEVSRDYVRLLSTLAVTVEAAPDKRMFILGYGSVYLRSGRDIERVESAFTERAEGEGQLSASEYLELGEVRTALDVALKAIDPQHGYGGDSPFDGLPPVHISTGRLDVLIKADRDELAALGDRVVVPRMEAHIEHCDGCSAAMEDRVKRLRAATAVA